LQEAGGLAREEGTGFERGDAADDGSSAAKTGWRLISSAPEIPGPADSHQRWSRTGWSNGAASGSVFVIGWAIRRQSRPDAFAL